ncbi:MAG: HsdM family class I SAM-dependent methyltransferase [Stellaceae bacterium]
MPKKPQNSEVDAYVYIKENLKLLGWDTRNPARHPAGRVYTQNECLSHPEIKKAFGLSRPENVVKISETTYWVIEAKRNHKQLTQAISEAEDYAADLNKGSIIRASFVSGIAGNQLDGYLIRTKFFAGRSWKYISFNGKDISSLISPEIARVVLEQGPAIADVPIDETLFLSKAEKINQILHLGGINKDYRARVMAALLLALVDETMPNIDASPHVLIQDINTRAKEVLRSQSKEEFYEYVRISLPASQDNHIQFKSALVKTIQELQNLNIRSAMNSGTDVLGKFYEVFLKYGNGVKEIGIVLTPRQITKFAVEVTSITESDIVYDPCCGTGGFLIAAFDHIKQTRNPSQIDRFKQNNLFGVDPDSAVVSLAIVNMIFRGDGKNNIIEGSALNKNLHRTVRKGTITAEYAPDPPEPEQAVVSRVLMNPPFALPSSENKEFRFINAALAQMQDSGILFSVLPYSALVKSGEYQLWRTQILDNHTLLSVITFPPDLFYPVSVHTAGIFLKKGLPHPREQNILWIRAINDGLAKLKGKRLASTRAKNDFPTIIPILKAFLMNQTHPISNVKEFCKACPIDFDDPLLELVPENYLDEIPATPQELAAGIEAVMRNTTAYLVRAGRKQQWS